MSEDPSQIIGYVLERPDSSPGGFGDYIILDVVARLIYYWPERLRLQGPSQQELDVCTSKTQERALLEPSFEVGQRVQCRVVNERRGIVNSVRKYGNVQNEYKIHLGVLSFKTICIFTGDDVKQCSASPLGEVEVDQEYVREVLPHVPFNGYIVFDVNKETMQCSYRLDHIDTDVPIVSNMLDYAGTASWHTRGVESVEIPLADDDIPEEVERWREATKRDFDPREKLEGRGFFVSMREIFCNAVKFWRVKVVWVDPAYRKELWAGRLVNFKACFCHHNACYVVYHWCEFDWPIETRLLSGQNAVHGGEATIFKAGLIPTGIADDYDVHSEETVYAYIEYRFSDELSVEFCGKAYVIGLAGQLYAAELYAYKCLLPTEMHKRFQLGHTVRIKATYNAETEVFEVSEAEAIGGDSVVMATSVHRTTKQVALKLRVTCSTQHPMFFEHPVFGPIRSISAPNISVARVKNIQPIIKIVDNVDDSPDPRYRFKCIAIERDGFR